MTPPEIVEINLNIYTRRLVYDVKIASGFDRFQEPNTELQILKFV